MSGSAARKWVVAEQSRDRKGDSVVVGPVAPKTIEIVVTDTNGGEFMLSRYDVLVGDTLRFKYSGTGALKTIYVLTQDGQQPAFGLLGEANKQFDVASTGAVDKPLSTKAIGTYLLSLHPSPQDPPEMTEPDGGPIVPIIVSN